MLDLMSGVEVTDINERLNSGFLEKSKVIVHFNRHEHALQFHLFSVYFQGFKRTSLQKSILLLINFNRPV